ncbi:hypothetical protein [Methylocystis echinoides]|uniref:hypothetical protein n=1 Tax=Methylocystis echinoides TaxID=29468 RepID=UPI00343E8F46
MTEPKGFLAVTSALKTWGAPPEAQQRLGALVIVWGVFETHLERLVCDLTAHVSANLLDLAVESSWVLCRIVLAAQAVHERESTARHILALRSDAKRVNCATLQN